MPPEAGTLKVHADGSIQGAEGAAQLMLQPINLSLRAYLEAGGGWTRDCGAYVGS